MTTEIRHFLTNELQVMSRGINRGYASRLMLETALVPGGGIGSAAEVVTPKFSRWASSGS